MQPDYDPVHDLVEGRAKLLANGDALSAAELRAALLTLHEHWLVQRADELGITAGSGMAIMAVGGLGRRELLPHSDLDLVLLHGKGAPSGIAEIADRLWYPLWDAHVQLDHSVRTPAQALAVAAEDVTAALGMLELRPIAGDTELAGGLVGSVYAQWRSGIRNRLDELAEQAHERWERVGEVAHRVEPDLKHGRGGLRDLQLLSALAAAQVINRTPGLSEHSPGGGLPRAHALLLDVRTELHRVSGRARDVLRAQDADEIAVALGRGDRFTLARELSDAARTVSYSVEVGLRTARSALPRRGLATLRRAPVRRPLAEGVVEHGGEVALAKGVRAGTDPALSLRVALASARTGLPIAGSTLNALADAPPQEAPVWPRPMLANFLALLGTGRAVIGSIEALDRADLWCTLVPEWSTVRDLPPRDAAHVWSVDRHLMETCAYAGSLTTRVSRPDLLLVGALLHDIAKGLPGDHSEVGAEMIQPIARRMGLPEADVQTLSAMVRHHLLLPVTASRRDLNDPATIEAVVDAVGGDRVLLELLHALTEADSRATGPGMWGSWKASLVEQLVSRCRLMTRGEPLPEMEPLSVEHRALAEAGKLSVTLEPATTDTPMLVRVVAPDAHNVLAAAAGVLALHSLRVHSASVREHAGAAVDTFMVSPRFGSPPDVALLRQDLARALRDDAELAQRLAAKEATYGEHATDGTESRVLWVDEGVGPAVLELRAADRTGLLYRVAAVLQQRGVQIEWARVETMGSSVADAFGLHLGDADTPVLRKELTAAVLAVTR
ncbi:[protein-PII] uridylyltransferase [Rhodococcus sp. X156]|uniref:[protein-PII] uridylyltransferase n=1 Tax=Rhodococcus sp. X156 TaxID=2499145 RepID=UPI000FDAF160|nr:[protein-PII] uridylyltransferase [Rhodococcus sp. X156]